MGLLLGPAFALLYSVAAIPIARLADRASLVLILAGGCAIWSGFTAFSGLATSPWQLVIARIGVGIGEAAYQAPAAALIASYFPLEQRARAFALVGTSIYFGQMLGYVGGPAIAATHGWRAAFQYIGMVGILVAAVAALLIREPARSTAAAPKREPEALLPLFGQLWSVPAFRNMTLGMALGSLSGVTFGMWGPALFERAYGLSTQEASGAFGLAFGIPGLAGMLGYGLLADRLTRRGIGWPLKVSAAALLAATILILAVTWAPGFGLAKALAIPSGLLGGGWSIGIIAGLQYILPDNKRATGTALALLVVSLTGNVLGPFLAGHLSDLLPGDAARRLQLALSIVIPTGLVGAWLLLKASSGLAEAHGRLNGQSDGGLGEPGKPI